MQNRCEFKIWLLCCLIVGWCSAAGGQETQVRAVMGGHWFNTQQSSFQKNRGLQIEQGRFAKLDAAVESTGEAPDILQLSDDDYILPGLIDLHAHYNVRLLNKRREEFHVIPIQYLANGITVTFSCGEYDPEGMLRLRTAIERGEAIGPRLITSGPYFGRARPSWHGDPDQVRDEVDFWVERGVGGFKAKVIDPPSLRALIEQAHKHGLTVTGHLGSGFRNSVNPRDAIDMGIDRIEHFLGGDAMTADRPAYSTLAGIRPDMPEFKAIVQKYVDAGVYFDATITAYGYFGSRGEQYEYWYDEPSLFTPYVRQRIQQRLAERPRRPMRQFQQIFEVKQQTIDDFWRAGGLVTLGTDHFSDGSYLPGFGAHRELEALTRSGIPAAEAIKIATINGARALKIDQQHGSIEAGKSADLLVVTGNPIQDIKNTRRIKYVIRAGKVYEPNQLLASVQGKLGPTNDEEAKAW